VVVIRPPFIGPVIIGVPSGGGFTVVETGSSPIGAAPVAPVEAIVPYQYERYMTVKNGTQERARFSILLSDKNGNWILGDGTAEKALIIELDPGQSYKLALGEQPLSAAKARIWASTQSRSYTEYRDNDLWLVGMDASYQRRYQAPAMETFTFNLFDR
jgi:hypothetical protein